mmetsp:Transcript_4213/g.13718  ORF Transcript_4213/g.13718 Transcript_4213/m.13718 type:complete len:333 (+) Transcript_4213:246-1244(+)
MRRVRKQRDGNVARGARRSVVRSTQVVLDVTGRAPVVRQVRPTMKLGKDGLKRFPHDVREHVQATTVCHAEVDGAHAVRRRAVNERLETDDERVGPVKTEALLLELASQKLFKEASPGETVVDDTLGLRVEAVGYRPLNARANPVDDLSLGNVHELVPDSSTVRSMQHVTQGAQGDKAALVCAKGVEARVARVDELIEVGVGPTVVREFKVGRNLLHLGKLKWIGLGKKMTANGKRSHHQRRLHGIFHVQSFSVRHVGRCRTCARACARLRTSVRSFHGLKIFLPRRIDGRRILGPASVLRLDPVGRRRITPNWLHSGQPRCNWRTGTQLTK